VQRRIQEIARAREEARRKRQEAKRKAAVNPLQALWDANGAAIYAANQDFKKKYGRSMSARARRKAIKDATVNGHFSVGAYAGNLVRAATPPPPYIPPGPGNRDPWKDIDHENMSKQAGSNPPTPTATPTLLPSLPTAIPLPSPEEDYDVTAPDLKKAALQALLRATNLPTAISRRTLIAMASAETGDYYHWDQEHEINGDNGIFNSGILQVDKLEYRTLYGAPQPYNLYNNSATGYNNAVQDAVALLNDLSAGMADGTYTALDDAFTSLPNGNGDTARLLVYYNAGENYPLETYRAGSGNRDYLGSVAYYLEASEFGSDYNDLLLAEDLYAAQEELDRLIDNP
jgi:hypothetical protein